MKKTNWRKTPILVAGYDIRRWEKPASGTDLYDPKLEKKLIFGVSRGEYGPTHLQFHSPFGFLLVWPLCFHIWFQFRSKQYRVSDGNVLVAIPGSEVVAYFRIGFARWDAGDGIYLIPTLFLGGHFD